MALKEIGWGSMDRIHLSQDIIIIIIIIIIEFLTSQLWLGNIHLFWNVVINRIRLGALICSCIYVFGCRLCLVRLYYYYYHHHHHLLYAGYLYLYS